MSRDEALKALDTERAYQEARWGAADQQNTVGDFLTYMRRELDKAALAYRSPADPLDDAMAGIRKVAAIGVAAIEKFGRGTPR